MSNGSTPPGGWWLVANEWSGHSFKICPSIPAAATAQLGAVTRDIDDAAAEESDEQGEDSADSRVVSVSTSCSASGMGLFIEILESRMFVLFFIKTCEGHIIQFS